MTKALLKTIRNTLLCLSSFGPIYSSFQFGLYFHGKQTSIHLTIILWNDRLHFGGYICLLIFYKVLTFIKERVYQEKVREGKKDRIFFIFFPFGCLLRLSKIYACMYVVCILDSLELELRITVPLRKIVFNSIQGIVTVLLSYFRRNTSVLYLRSRGGSVADTN